MLRMNDELKTKTDCWQNKDSGKRSSESKKDENLIAHASNFPKAYS